MVQLPPYGQHELSSPDSNETENYEALLSLAERLGEAKPRGLARPEIDQLPSYKFNVETHTGKIRIWMLCVNRFEFSNYWIFQVIKHLALFVCVTLKRGKRYVFYLVRMNSTLDALINGYG